MERFIMHFMVLVFSLASIVSCKNSGISGVPGFKAEPALTGKNGQATNKAKKILGSSWEACIPYKDKETPKCSDQKQCGTATYFQATVNLTKMYIMEIQTKNRFSDEYCTLKHLGYSTMEESTEILAINDLKPSNKSDIVFKAIGSNDQGEIESDVKLENISSASLTITSQLQSLKGRNKVYKVQK